MDEIKFHCDKKPKIGELVQVVFTERHEQHTEGYLTEYEGSGIMTHSQATKKKKIKSYNKIIPLNKPLPATIEEFDGEKNYGNVSRAYLDDPDDLNNAKFLSNSKIINLIYQECLKKEINFKDFWTEKVFPFLEKIKEDKVSYLESFIENIDMFKDELNEDLYDIFENIKIKVSSFQIKKKTFQGEIGIISNGGVEVTKKLIKDSLNELSQEVREKFLVKYNNTPKFLLQSEYSEESIKEFALKVQEKSKSLDNVFVKLY